MKVFQTKEEIEALIHEFNKRKVDHFVSKDIDYDIVFNLANEYNARPYISIFIDDADEEDEALFHIVKITLTEEGYTVVYDDEEGGEDSLFLHDAVIFIDPLELIKIDPLC